MLNRKDTKHIIGEGNITELKVLIVEDHALMQAAIKNVFLELSKSEEKYKFVIDTASSCKVAYEKISTRNNYYELILLDIQLPAYPSQKLFSGADIGTWIKNTLHLSSKIIIITLIKDKIRIQDIINTINPDGFLVKGDITPETLLDALKKIFESTTAYYSESVTKYSQKLISSNDILNTRDRQILYEISQGATNVEIKESLVLSKSTVQNCKGKLMDFFNVTNNSNKELIKKAQEQGFL